MTENAAGKFVEIPLQAMFKVEELCVSPYSDSEKLVRFKKMLDDGLPLNARAEADMNEPLGFKTIIEVAARTKCEPILLYMLEHDPLLVNYPKRVFVEIAGMPAAVRQMLSQGYSVKDSIAEFPLQTLGEIIGSAHPETLRIMAEEGVDFNGDVRWDGGVIPLILHRASIWTDDQFIHLAKLGCDMKRQLPKNGFSVLHVLVGGIEGPNLDRGFWADTFTKSLAGTKDSLLDRFKARVDAAIEAGADINAVDRYGETALHLAAKFDIVDKVKALIEAGADIAIKNQRGNTALALALAAGQEAAGQAIRAHMAQEAVMSVVKAARQRRAPT
jgi:phage gp46-like protein